MEKNIKYLIIIFSMLLISCGTRKVNKNEILIEEKNKTTVLTKDSTNTKINITENVKILSDSVYEEITVIPLDSTKESVFNNIVFKNVKFNYKKHNKTKKEEKNTNKDFIETKTITKDSTSSVVKKQSQKVKTIESKKSNTNFYIIIILIIIILIVIKKYYNKINIFK